MPNPNTVATPIIDKNGKPNTVHKGRAPKPTPPARTAQPQQKVTPLDTNAAIEQVIADFVEEGTLTDVGGEWETKNTYLGTTSEGMRISAQIVVFERKGVTTTDLKPLDKVWAIDISGSGRGNGSDWAAGMLAGELGDGLQDSMLDDTNRARFAELWNKFYNHSRLYGTEKQYKQEEELHASGMNMSDDNWSQWSRLIEDDRGHVFGSDSLYRPISADELAEMVVLLDIANIEFEKQDSVLHKFAAEARENVIAEGLDPDAISPQSIHGNLTNADNEEIILARREAEYFEDMDENRTDHTDMYGGVESFKNTRSEAVQRFLELSGG